MSNRVIKFRAWDGERMHNNVVPWHWDFCISLSWHKCERSTGSGILGSGGKEGDFLVPGIAFKHIMQFTGLKDKNGKEIYEGDRVDFAIKRTWCDCKEDIELLYGQKFCPCCGKSLTSRDFVTPATIGYEKAAFYLHYKKKDDREFIWGFYAAENFIQWIEVIGNIYENPELLNPL